MGQESEERAVQGNPDNNRGSKPAPKKQMRISSPEQVDDYIHVTTPGMWLLLVAMLVLLCSGIIWAYATKIEVKKTGQDGQVTTEYVTPGSFLTDGTAGN